MGGMRTLLGLVVASACGLVACGGDGFTAGPDVPGDQADSGPSCCGETAPPTNSGDAAPQGRSDATSGPDAGADVVTKGPSPDSGCCGDASPPDAGQDSAPDAREDAPAEAGSDAGPSGDAGADSATTDGGGTGSDGSADAADAAVCTNGQADCAGPSGAPRSCVNGQWVDQTACSGSNSVCVAGKCAVCNPTATLCSGNGLETCDPTGHWTAPVACSGANPVCLGTACVQCNPTDKTCQGSDSLSCDQTGHWQTTSSCQYGCKGAGVCNACAPNMVKCDLSNDNQDHAFVCDPNNVWQQDGIQVCQAACKTTGRFNVDAVNNTVGDTTTGLVWQRSSSPTQFNDGFAAANYCPSLAPAGTWREPTMAELSALLFQAETDGGTPSCQPDIDQVVFPDTYLTYFTSDSIMPLQYSYVSFAYGTTIAHASYTGGVKCVKQ